jgi:hypothetical protein
MYACCLLSPEFVDRGMSFCPLKSRGDVKFVSKTKKVVTVRVRVIVKVVDVFDIVDCRFTVRVDGKGWIE